MANVVPKKNNNNNEEDNNNKYNTTSVSDEWNANIFQIMTFSWLLPLIKVGYSRQLLETDVGENYKRDKVKQYLKRFEKNLQNGTKETIRSTIWKTFSEREYYAVACKFISDATQLFEVQCMFQIILYAEVPSNYGDEIWMFAIGMLILPLIRGLCNHWFYQFVMIDGLHARTSIQAAVYSKILRISNAARTKSAKEGGIADSIMNLQSTDCRSIEMCYWMWMYVWAAPIMFIFATVLLYFQLGWPVFVGIFFLACIAPIQKKVYALQSKYQKSASEASDQRIKLITEMIHGIQVIKLQAWENIFNERIKKTRSIEIRHRRSIQFVQAFNSAMTSSAPIISAIITFTIYGKFVATPEDPLTAAKAFVSLAYFNMLNFPMRVIPMLIGMFAGATVAAKRLGNFLYSDDLVNYVTYEENTINDTQNDDQEQRVVVVVEVKNGAFIWDSIDVEKKKKEEEEEKKDEKENKKNEKKDDKENIQADTNNDKDNNHNNTFKLRIPSFSLKQGTLTVVAGKVGCGKSSLLSALLGEMSMVENNEKNKGTVVFRGTVAYCAQEPWIQNATLRDNIIFGSPFDEERYEQVLNACALKADIDALPGGDQTEIGERGINLSGGQKARVSLGRACYADKDIVILDDILSAVDAHVARQITDECLVNLLRNQGKTVIIATHQTLCFPNADNIVILKHGEIVYNGTFTDGKNNNDFNDVLGSNEDLNTISAVTTTTTGETSTTEVVVVGGDTTTNNNVVKSDEIIITKVVDETTRKSSTESNNNNDPNDDDNDDHDKKTLSEKGKLTKDEATKEGAVTCSVYTSYAAMAGIPMTIFILLLAMSMNGGQIAANWWLSRWSISASNPNDANSLDYYLGIYALLGIGACLLILIYYLTTVVGGLGAAAGIHSRMVKSYIKAPMSFHDTTASGQILNHFTADMKSIDEQLITQLSGAMSLLFMMVAALVTMIVILPWIVIFLIPLFMFYGWIQLVYRNTARELKRYDSKTQSPIFHYFGETVNGLSTIRAFNCEGRLMLETEKRVDYNSRFWTKNNFVNRWLGLRLDWIGAFLLGVTAISCVLAVKFVWPIDAGLIGLVLTYTASLTGLLNWGVRRFSEAELGMVAVERTKALSACPQEFTKDPIQNIDSKWPEFGEIILKNVSAQYRKGLPKVLKSINLVIPKCTKVGVCGRTGSGKTTLAKCLFRLMEIMNDGGFIEIDSLDISKVELSTLRKKITMIPQDPTLFAGPLRYSLDP